MRSGLFNCIVVKDLSRLGRNYVETGNYIERVFPFFDVRFIAVTDGYDSNKSGEELLMPLKNMVNEMYVKDLSDKMKSAYRAKWSNGEFCSGKVPYGYLKEGRHLIPDPETKDIVVRIYQMFLAGNSLREICKTLSREVLNPSSFQKVKKGGQPGTEDTTYWRNATVRHILSSEVYAGDYVHNKQKRSKLENASKLKQPADQWVIIRDTHEPLVSREDFNRVQEMLDKNVQNYHRTHGENGFNHAQFNLLGKRIVCADCGKVMGFRTRNKNHTNRSYRCRTYLDTIKKECTSHKISADAVNNAVLHEIREHMRLCIDAENTVRRMNAKTENLKKYDIYGKEAERIRKELQKATEVKAGIFEDYRDKLIDEEQYVQISGKYAAKIKELSARLEEMLKAQAAFSSGYHIDEDWRAVIDKYLNKRKLTKEMVEAFVDKVIVHDDLRIEVHLKYEDVLSGLQKLSAEREAD